MPNALTKGFISAQVGDTLANYVRADLPLKHSAHLNLNSHSNGHSSYFEDDNYIWTVILGPSKPQLFDFDHVVISEWVARIPGLYWLPGSDYMRRLNPSQIESVSGQWKTYSPQGKSRKVSGGVGTFRFPPADDGYRLVTLTASYNASSGVPALISPEVWESHKLAEGNIIAGKGVRWRDMPQRWASQFPVTSGIPRGCLVLDRTTDIQPSNGRAPVQAHPFSIMEYWDGVTQLCDFVFATIDTSESGFRREVSVFFEKYRRSKGRDGSYLIAADISDPLWDATFTSPEAMRESKAAQLRLIEQRVKDATAGKDVVEALLRKLSSFADVTTLKRLSVKTGIPWQKWSQGGLLSDEASRLIDVAINDGKQPALLQTVQFEYSQ